MNLLFSRNSDEEISVFICRAEEAREPFSYTAFIKTLMADDELGPPSLEGSFSPEEEKSIQSMVSEINKVLLPEDSPDEDDQVDDSDGRF